ncbi:MAG: hypothetical protein R3E39_09190 [Anaerolineae bacterium]
MWLRVYLISFLLVTFASTVAQENDREIWNWAWRSSTGELFAYSTSGAVTTLLSQGTTGIYGVWRIDNEQAVGLIDASSQTMFYKLNSSTIQAFTLNFELHDLTTPLNSRYGYRLEDYSYPYMLFTPSTPQTSPPSEPAILINLDSNQIELLSNQVQWIPYGGCCHFSEDGRFLRYIVIEKDQKPYGFELHERKLANLTERVVFTHSSNSLFSSDSYGERWLELEQSGTINNRVYNIFDLTGAVHQVYQQSPLETYADYDFLNDDLVSYQPLCETNCSLKLMTGDGKILTLALPPARGGASVWPVSHFDNKLVIGRLDGYWLLSVDQAPILIGFNFCSGCHLPSSLSPDKRWLMVADSNIYPPHHVMIWDLQTQKVVINIPIDSLEPVYQMLYDIDGFILQAWYEADSFAYKFVDQMTFELPYQSYGVYFDILPDGSVLYSSLGNSGLSAGIYRYYPDDALFKLILENVEYVPTMDVNYESFPV